MTASTLPAESRWIDLTSPIVSFRIFLMLRPRSLCASAPDGAVVCMAIDGLPLDAVPLWVEDVCAWAPASPTAASSATLRRGFDIGSNTDLLLGCSGAKG